MTSLHRPGMSVISSVIQRLRKGETVDLSVFPTKEIDMIRSLYDDYLMNIWFHLGDTNFNRLGYRNATDHLSRELQILNQEKINAVK
jgi:hypothetical protein